MAKDKITKEDSCIAQVQQFASYVNKDEKTIGIYTGMDNARVAEASVHLKRLKSKWKYVIQMVISND